MILNTLLKTYIAVHVESEIRTGKWQHIEFLFQKEGIFEQDFIYNETR
jgi:hypothetical protein